MNCSAGPRALMIVSLACFLPLQVRASCDGRPGTPNSETVAALSDTEIIYAWRVKTHGRIWYDIYVRGPGRNHQDLGKDLTGVPGDGNEFQYNWADQRVIRGLQANKTYCVSIRARTGSGTDGCVSQRASSWQCATTLAWRPTPATPPPAPPPPPHQDPSVGNKCCWGGGGGPFIMQYSCGPQCH
jgi:hypothetical protein